MNEKIFKNLDNYGFYILRNVLNDKTVNFGRNCFNGTKVNYLK